MDSLLIVIVALAFVALFANVAVTFGVESRDGFDRRDAGVRS